MMAIYAINFYVLIMIILPATNGQKAPVGDGNSLWCVEGEKKVFSPVQCTPETTECFKFNCDGIEEPFVARGCGLSVLTSAAGLPNESCHQAQSVCEYIGGRSSCFTCNNKHMCNQSNNLNLLVFLLVFLLPICFSSLFVGLN